MSAALPGHCGTSHGTAARSNNQARQPFLHIEVLDRLMQGLGVTATGAPLGRMVIPQELLDTCDADIGKAFLADIGPRAASAPLLGGLRLSELAEAFQTILWHEAAASNAVLLQRRADSIDPQVRARLERGQHVSAAELAEARQLQAYLTKGMALRLNAGDVAVFPTLPVTPPQVNAAPNEFDRFRQRIIALTCLSGLTGWPQLVLPRDASAPTQSISLLSPARTDRLLLDFANRLSVSTPEKL